MDNIAMWFWFQFLFIECHPLKLEFFSQELWVGGKIEFKYFGDNRRYLAFMGFSNGIPSVGVFN